MKSSLFAVLLLLGAAASKAASIQEPIPLPREVSFVVTDEAVQADESLELTVDKATVESMKLAQKKAEEAKKKALTTKKKVEAMQAMLKATSTSKDEPKKGEDKSEKGDRPPESHAKLQTQQAMDFKAGDINVSVDGSQQTDKASKLQQLEAMEDALKKATEAAHMQREALSPGGPAPANATANAVAPLEIGTLHLKQVEEQQALVDKLASEEKMRQLELKENEEIESKIAEAEKQRMKEEQLAQERSDELKKLQAEEAAQKLEAEKMEEEFLAAKAAFESKAIAAKKAAAKANLARLKRKHELSRRKAQAQMQMLKVKQQMEEEHAHQIEEEHKKVEDAKKKAQQEEAARVKALAEKKAKDEAEKKKKEEEAKLLAQKKAAEEKKKEEEAKKAAEKKKAEEKQKQMKLAQQKKLEKERKQKEAKIASLTQQYGKDLKDFGSTLNKKAFEDAIGLRDQIKKLDKAKVPPVSFSAVDAFKNGFTFPQIAQNDFAKEQIESLVQAQVTLAADPSEAGLTTFLKTAEEIESSLKERYKDQWVDPTVKDEATKEEFEI